MTGQWVIFYTGPSVTLKVITDTIMWWKFQGKACEGDLMSGGIDSAGKCLSPLGHWFKHGPVWLWPKAVTAWQLCNDLRETSGFRPVPFGVMSTPRGTYSCSRYQLQASEELPAAWGTVWTAWTLFPEALIPSRGCHTYTSRIGNTHTPYIS